MHADFAVFIGPVFKDKKNTTKFKKDKESKNKEEIEVIHERDSGNIRLLRLDKASNYKMTTSRKIDNASAFIERIEEFIEEFIERIL